MELITENRSLTDQNSFGVPITARRYVEFATPQELRAFFAHPEAHHQPWLLLSGGNNVLFRGDYSGTVLHPVSRGIELLASDSPEWVRVRVAAGEEWDDVVAWAVEHGYGGVENLSQIPGYMGAAPVQNIGAYGVEICEVIESLELYLTESDEVVTLTESQCRFAYRDSIFKHELRGRAIILSVVMRLSTTPHFRLAYGELKRRVEEAGEVTLASVRSAVMAIRTAKLPDPKLLGNAGSFFKNPVVERPFADRLREQYPLLPIYEVDDLRVKLPAGWLIEQAGWRGKRCGNVGVHEAQALVLVNYGGATGEEILALAHAIQADVCARFGVEIEMEVNVV